MDKNRELLLKMAKVLADNKDCTTQYLADSINISKASLHRIFKTKEFIHSMILSELNDFFSEIDEYMKEKAKLEYKETLEYITRSFFDNYELLKYGYEINKDLDDELITNSLDDFFRYWLGKNKLSHDFSVEMITEVYLGILITLKDSVDRQRITNKGLLNKALQLFENAVGVK